MKNFLLLVFISSFLIQCKPKEKETSKIQFHINNFDFDNDQMEVTFELVNNSNQIWEAGKWELNWNQFSGDIDKKSLPNGIKLIPTKNIQYYRLSFGDSFSISPGDKFSFSAIQKGIMKRLVMGPVGFFVYDQKNSKFHDLESKIIWQNAKGLESLNIPSAADRFLKYEGIKTLSKEDLHWVIPTPRKMILQNQKFGFPKSLNIDFGNFKNDHEFLKNYLQKGLSIDVKYTGEPPQIIVNRDSNLDEEAYHLKIDKDIIRISVSNYKGLLYSFSSLRQILYNAQIEKKDIPLLYIEDAPRFKHRGFMLDLSRNFYPKNKILQILELMTHYKLNILDLRLSDDEGWRIEIPGLEELTDIGGKRGFTLNEKDRLIPMYGSGSGEKNSPGNGYLSRDDFIKIIKEATKRNIEVIPQISFPSHARAAIIAMEARYYKFLEKGDLVSANQYRLHDPNDKSEYTSAQLFNDNVICICRQSAFKFFEKVFFEIKAMYDSSSVPMKIFNIGADEVPHGSWRKSPLCNKLISKSPDLSSFQSLYDASVKKLNRIISDSGAKMSGWEDVLLVLSEKSQSEIRINKNLIDLNFIPLVWNNTWGDGREDMIYKLANKGFKSVMSNSSAFYFDMTDDKDIENGGLNWSGYVDYQDTWGTEPLNVFANKVKLKELNADENELIKYKKLKKNSVSNFLGIQSQLWTETATDSYQFDRMLMPNLIVFSERAWSPKETWLEEITAEKQKPLLLKSWNRFVNTIGQRHLLYISDNFKEINFDLPKPGAIIDNFTLKARQQFPGLEIRYTLNGKKPEKNDHLYTSPVKIKSNDQVILRVFDSNGRGGNSIKIQK
tara:strand:- start:10884 stop:13388 length:2505 start_codon:yes stop_codon:yes gene_type:complete